MWPITQKPALAETWRGHAGGADLRRKPGFDASALRASPRGDVIQKSSPGPFANANDAAVHVPQNLPGEIAFLIHYGIAPGVLLAVAVTARAQGVTADAVLLAEGEVSEDHFYSSLARYLRLPFVADAGAGSPPPSITRGA